MFNQGGKHFEFHVYGNGMQSNTTISLKVYIMAVVDNYMSSIAIKYTLSNIVVFDCIPFTIFTHTTGMTLLDSRVYVFHPILLV